MAKNNTKPANRNERKKKMEEATSEVAPLKKKKLIPEVTEDLDCEVSQVTHAENLNIKDLTPEECRVFERKLKKERKKEEKRLKQESHLQEKKEEPLKPSGCDLSLQYLKSWSEKHKEWKFQKTRQTWLLLHMYDADKVPDEYFGILLDYLGGLKGSARGTTIQKAEALMKEYDRQETEEESEPQKVARIREVLQLLS
ncbi:protein cholesin [Discoglossus pictus]